MSDQLLTIVGADNMTAAAKDRVISILSSLGVPATTKRYLYGRWARTVGVALDPADTDRVAAVPVR